MINLKPRKRPSRNKKNTPERHERPIFKSDKKPRTYIGTVYVGNLRYSKSEEDLRKLFENYGKVNFVNIIMDPKTKKSKGIAFIQMADKKKAKLAVKALDSKLMDGRTLKVSMAIQSQEIDKKPKKDLKEKKDPTEVAESKNKKKSTRGLNSLFNYLNSK